MSTYKMASPLAHAVHTMSVQLVNLTKQQQDLEKKLKDVDTSLQQSTMQHQTDPAVLRRLNEIDDKILQLRENIRLLTEDFRTFKVQIRDTSAIETSIQTRLEQYITRLVTEKCNMISDETKMIISSITDAMAQSVDDGAD